MGHPDYSVSKGEIVLDGVPVLDLPPNKRAELGLFLAFQYPKSIPGVSLESFIRTAYSAIQRVKNPDFKITPAAFRAIVRERAEHLHLDPSFLERNVNEGFSGGEKKKAEILQLLVMEPLFAILDETDSGLDIDALKIVAEGINVARKSGMGSLIITHYQRILKYTEPDFVHVMKDGVIIESGGKELALVLEEKGYEWLKN
jgi:Fe-S cluster assembly ATP-binding protein